MKKIIICVIISISLNVFFNISYCTEENEIINMQKDTLNISDFLKEAEEYTEESMPNIDLNELLSVAISGNIDNGKLLNMFSKLIGNEVIESISIISSIIVIIVIHGILKSIGDGLENKSVAQITYYIQYILLVTVIMKNFSDIIKMIKETIENLVGLMNSLIPILITLILTTGNIASATIIQPIILFMITFIGNFITTIIVPIVLVSTALGIISQISDRIQIDKLAKFLKSSTVWILGVILTVFVGITSLEGNLSSSIDGVTAKTTKAAVSSFIPVVGKILGDAVDTVMGCSVILKNALGIIGVIIIIGICIVPIIKLAILMGVYYLTAALCQPIADGKIIKLLSHMGDTFKMLFAILTTVSVMLIIGVTLVVKISNTGVMYS
ncbi:MAG: stage III sporulation protein AE [Clostridiales bacterium]|nr:stage III sporulation protein AE [Clostridiales bacterium]